MSEGQGLVSWGAYSPWLFTLYPVVFNAAAAGGLVQGKGEGLFARRQDTRIMLCSWGFGAAGIWRRQLAPELQQLLKHLNAMSHETKATCVDVS